MKNTEARLFLIFILVKVKSIWENSSLQPSMFSQNIVFLVDINLFDMVYI